ncbi:MAG: hypothetical protein M1600_11595 [Firmicutes bacterium]|nr:hypothetical protein [Bacillota bacterium]
MTVTEYSPIMCSGAVIRLITHAASNPVIIPALVLGTTMICDAIVIAAYARGEATFLTNDAAIEVIDLSKTLRRERVLEYVNLGAQAGEILASPARTCRARLYSCGLATPTTGTVTIRGEALNRGRFPKDIGVIIDAPSFLAHLTGLENLTLLVSICNVVTPQEIEHTTDLLGFSFAKHKRVRYYSVGMRQRWRSGKRSWKSLAFCYWMNRPMAMIRAATTRSSPCSTHFEPKG